MATHFNIQYTLEEENIHQKSMRLALRPFKLLIYSEKNDYEKMYHFDQLTKWSL